MGRLCWLPEGGGFFPFPWGMEVGAQRVRRAGEGLLDEAGLVVPSLSCLLWRASQGGDGVMGDNLGSLGLEPISW